MPAVHFCSHCGTPVAVEGAMFCARCGAPVEVPVAAPPRPAAPPPPVSQFPPGPPPSQGGGLFRTLTEVVEDVVKDVVVGPGGSGSIAAAIVGGATGSRLTGAIAGAVFNQITHPRGHPVIIGAALKDRPDPSDVAYQGYRNMDGGSMPPFVDLRGWMSDVEDQGDLGSCTANAIAGGYEYLQNRITGKKGDVSRLFLYYMERESEGKTDRDSGASLRDGMKVLKNYGVCSERTWPYRKNAFRERPPDAAFEEAKAHTIDEYQRVPVTLEAMKACLAEGYPFVFGTEIYQSFESDGHHGLIQLPDGDEKDLGSHAMLAVGYSEKDRVFVVRNSWGTDWGDRGYCYLPYDYLANDEYTDDCWTLRRAHNLDFASAPTDWGKVLSFFAGDGSPLGAAADWHDRRARAGS